MTHKGFTTNEYGIRVSLHICDTCKVEFTLTPGVDADATGFDDCTCDECPSYDPDRDMDIVFMTDAEIARDKPIVSMKMLRKRRAFREGAPL